MESKKGLPFSCPDRFYEFCMRIKQKITHEDTHIIGILSGPPGCGKSVLGMEILYLVSGDKLTIEKLAFDKGQFIKAVLMSEKEGIQADEGIAIFFGRGAMTKEGRLMAELMAQIRQKNLLTLICIPDPLSVDSLVMNSAQFIAQVWESKKVINGRLVTIKGNMELYPKFPNNDYMTRLIQYLRIKRGNPLVKARRPKGWIRVPGSPYGPGFKGAFYPVDETAYKAKKDAVLAKYNKALERKPLNARVDYKTMDSMIKAKISNVKIAEILKVSVSTIIKHKATMK